MRWLMVFVLSFVGIWVAASACTPAAAPPAATPTPAAVAPTPTAATSPTAQAKAAAPTSVPTTSKPAPITVKLSRVASSLSDAPLIVALAKGYFAEEGLNVDTTLHVASSDVISALGQGELDVAGGGWSVAHANMILRGVPIEVVADKNSYQKGFHSYRISYRKDLYDSGELRKVAQLKGRKVALPSVTAMGPVLIPALKEAGLTLNDLNLVILGFPEMVPALVNKSVDAVVLSEPILTKAVDQGLVVRGPDLSYSKPNTNVGVIYFSPEFAKNTDAGNRFVLAYMKGVRAYNDAFRKNEGKQEIEQILGKALGITDLSLFEKMDMPGVNPDGYVEKDGMEADDQNWLSAGQMSGPLDLNKVIDYRFLDNALRVLGKYKYPS